MSLSRATRLVAACWLMASTAVQTNAGEPSRTAPESKADTREAKIRHDRAGYGHRVDTRKKTVFDPSIFTELSPVTVDENPVKLPEDQRLE